MHNVSLLYELSYQRVLLFISLLSWNISVPKSWNLPETPPEITRKPVSFPVTCNLLFETMKSSTNSWVTSPSRKEVFCPISMLYCCQRSLTNLIRSRVLFLVYWWYLIFIFDLARHRRAKCLTKLNQSLGT